MLHEQKRALVSAPREGVELGLEGGLTEGDVQERKGPHVHVTGETEKYWPMFKYRNYLFTPAPVDF